VTAQKLEQRANTQSDLIQKHLWHESDGIFTNRFWNSTFYARRSPTSFYAMMARASTDEQAERMMREWLLSPKHFCITENGDFVNNTDDCYWGLPSIEASDPAFPPLGYWRGYVWGPMAQLVYFSLREYDHVDIVRKSRKALCSQMKSLMLSQWNDFVVGGGFVLVCPRMCVCVCVSRRLSLVYLYIYLRCLSTTPANCSSSNLLHKINK